MSLEERFSQEALPHLEGLHHFAFKLCRNEQMADDLVQETMLKAFGSFDRYTQGTNCRAWLFQICKNIFINLYRRKQLEPLSVDMMQEMPEVSVGATAGAGRGIPVSLGDNADPRDHGVQLGDEVITALADLPQEYRTAVILSDIEEQSYEEIAEFMHVPIGTVRSRIHRGRKLLARHLHGYAKQLGWQHMAEAA